MSEEDGPREVEAKFEVDEAGRQALLALDGIGPFRVHSKKPRPQDDTYYDSADAVLGRAGATLRIRRLTDGALMTFKGLREPASGASDEEHLASRLEDEVAIDAALTPALSDRGPLPAALDASPARRARAISGDAELRPVARLENERFVIQLGDGAGNTIELAVDRCVGTRFSDGQVIEFDEVELEGKGVARAVLVATQRDLRALVPGLRPSQITKLERVLA